MTSIGSPSPFFLAGKKAYEVERSLRFNGADNAYLARTITTTGNRKTFTFSGWVKRSNITTSQVVRIFNCNISTNPSGTRGQWVTQVGFYTDDRIYAHAEDSSDQGETLSTAKYRDPSAWMHLLYVVDTTESAAADRIKVFVNGEQITLNFTNNVAQNADTETNLAGNVMSLGAIYFNGNLYMNSPFYLAEANFIDGQALTPSSFTETDVATGQLIPKEYVGTYGTNGFYLNFSDNSATTATTLGKDYSGNDNNFTPNNFSVAAGAGNDSLEDTPTNNFATMNPLVASPSVTWANGNLDLSGSSSTQYSQNNTSTFGVTSGKWYVEIKFTTGGSLLPYLGICPITAAADANMTGSVTDAAVLRMNNETYIEGTSASSGTSISSGDIIGIALDMDNQKVWFSVQGTYINSGNPSTGANATFDGITAGETIAICARPLNGTFNFNFGQRAFSYTPPTGFKKLNSANLPDPTIKLPNKHFDTVTYTGAGSGTQNITSLNFQPDWVWIKGRSSGWHVLVDAIRGVGKILASNETDAEDNSSDAQTAFSAFLSNGFTVGYNTSWYVNGAGSGSSQEQVAWNWNAGGTTVTNNDGSISSQVRANTTAGFSIVTYTGQQNASDTIGHGLGVKPQVVISKSRNSTYTYTRWYVHHHKLTTNYGLFLDDSSASFNGLGDYYIDASFSSTVFAVGDDIYGPNVSSNNYVAYCFSEVEGFSKFGSYTGNGSSDGAFVFTGFRPAWLMVKKSDGGNSWTIMDSNRDIDNPTGVQLFANSSDADYSATGVDFISNGFKCRNSAGEINASGGTYIYLAFAESPFKNSRAR